MASCAHIQGEATMSLSSKIRSLAFAVSLTAPMLVLPATQAHAGVFISVGFAPPVLPVYVQPPLPAPGYIWTPGYWAYGDAGYYWVPGVWVSPPRAGVLWTPGYWGFAGGVYGWHAGYWGPHVGFYGGVNYGFGYGGVGFFGGEWRGGVFAYNSAVANFGGVHVTNVYENRTIVERNTIVNKPCQLQRRRRHRRVRRQWRCRPQTSTTSSPPPTRCSTRTSPRRIARNWPRSTTARPEPWPASNVNSYHQVAQQHAQSQPISAADRTAGRHYNPNTREANQDQRIANGLRSGQMTSGEAARAERTQSRIDQQVHNDRVANGGKLTGQERQQINGEQNAASRQIYNEKHNGNTVTPNEVDNREANQQQRTANGLRSGQMTSGEAARTNRNQAKRRPAGPQRTHRQWRRADRAAEDSRSTANRTRTAGRSTTRSTTTRPQNPRKNAKSRLGI